MSLNKLYDSPFVQIYQDSKKVRNNEQYEYIYKYLNSDNNDVQIYKSEQFPHNLILSGISAGFLFVHNNADIPILPDIECKDYKTNLKCLSNGFIKDSKVINKNNEKYNVVMNVRPAYNCHPNCINDYTIGLHINTNIIKLNEKNEIIKHFMEIQPKFKNIKEWKNYIYSTCPIKIHFMNNINDKTFSKNITEKDMSIDYDIHDVDEINIVKIIENTFEDMNQMVKIFDNYNNIVNRIKNECDKLNIKYNSSENVKHKRLKYKGELKNMRYNGIKWIELKYSDLLKCNIKYLLTDFIS